MRHRTPSGHTHIRTHNNLTLSGVCVTPSSTAAVCTLFSAAVGVVLSGVQGTRNVSRTVRLLLCCTLYGNATVVTVWCPTVAVHCSSALQERSLIQPDVNFQGLTGWGCKFATFHCKRNSIFTIRPSTFHLPLQTNKKEIHICRTLSSRSTS